MILYSLLSKGALKKYKDENNLEKWPFYQGEVKEICE